MCGKSADSVTKNSQNFGHIYKWPSEHLNFVPNILFQKTEIGI